MRLIDTPLPGLALLEPTVFHDERGSFCESYQQSTFDAVIGRTVTFVQDNQVSSVEGVLRGLHEQQAPRAQGKLVRAVQGEVFDVAVDLRESSPTFLQWAGVTLSAANRRQLWIPEGFAHGYLVLSAGAEVLYKTTDTWCPALERTIAWNDPRIGIRWPLAREPILSEKDRLALPFDPR
ncbi:dTDP-4-dehydrorhamnose 3,5-epimerase [Microvirgula sp. AG722]|uniref:dTDP-4-dehydrorhamnose 3,5-epimerase n=1 Tax=Microvirgula aerodenitrificans TaxID=57480 RepID=A0A2S0P9H4_9NEIS|nr:MULTISPECIES: dTDP-4-dehydrorhamnose 3,5-epimerase [Microvirgula]AVY94064.1 dTDP-4-dehydrorhamnose 3,5-epimerase [Microvirgula aerodenitrificans]RAS13828.1 dTDP-4-dehydrorhamnose 3,5-epimerase [Microvirgula sp. AG722]